MSDLSDPLARPPGVRHVALVPAAGVGARMGADRPKQYLPIGPRTVLECTVGALLGSGRFERVVVVVSPLDPVARSLPALADGRVSVVPVGGATRRDSVLAGLKWLQDTGLSADEDWIWVHDAARPGVVTQDLDHLSQGLESACDGAVLALAVADTLRRTDARDTGLAAETVPREGLWQAQTPQVFRARALRAALARHAAVTDEAAAMRLEGAQVRLVEGSRRNFKITTADDLALMRAILDRPETRTASTPGESAPSDAPASQDPLAAGGPTGLSANPNGLPWRVGQGWDVHALVPGRLLILGGVQIPYDRGLLGHSDADALLHAITDALLGAAGMGDIGRHFPDTDPQFAGADSRVLLRETLRRVRAEGWDLANVDATVVAQSPRLAPFISAMRRNLSEDLGMSGAQVNVKAKTSERLGFAGRGEGIEAHAVVLLSRRP
jgi:2-C-methyl-D-erythritol 4-phosphate cytidylyltransferase/2-C-methyl-D-erythritol 2,4-cyclodiphosphate synthase